MQEWLRSQPSLAISDIVVEAVATRGCGSHCHLSRQKSSHRPCRALIQLINLGTAPFQLLSHKIFADLYVVPKHFIMGSLPAVEAICAPLQAAMIPLDANKYQQSLDQLAIPLQDYSLPRQHLFHQQLEKHLLTFVDDPEDYGCTEVIDHPIHTGSTPPIWERYQHILPALWQEVKDKIQNMLQSGIIKERRSPWATHVVLVHKKNGSLWFCVDYCKYNACTQSGCLPTA